MPSNLPAQAAKHPFPTRLGAALLVSGALHLLMILLVVGLHSSPTGGGAAAGGAGLLARLVPSTPNPSQEAVGGLVSASSSPAHVPPDKTLRPVPEANSVPPLSEDSSKENALERDTGVSEGSAPLAPRRVNVEALRAYSRELGAATARFRRYPTDAGGVAAGVGGRTIFRLDVAAGGRPRSLHLLSSSGHEILDRSALDMLRLAASHTSVPEELQGDDFIIDLAVDFAPPSGE